MAKAKYWAWNVLALVTLGIVYFSLISEGLRFLIPALAQKVHKLPVPLFGLLRHWRATQPVDLANLLAIFLFMAVWHLWGMILKARLGSDEQFHRSGWNPEAYRSFVMQLGSVVLAADIVFFYVATTQMGWGGKRFSFLACVATAAYVGVLLFVKLVSINLEKEIPIKEETPCIRLASSPEVVPYANTPPSSRSSEPSAPSPAAKAPTRTAVPPG